MTPSPADMVAYIQLVASPRVSRWRDLPTAVLMLAPSMIILTIFVIYPLVQAVWLGQTRCDAQGQNCTSNGWDQYVDVARSVEFQDALWVTVKFALLTVPAGLILGVGLAVLADKYLRGLAVFRFIFTSTVATSVAVASLMWLFLLQPDVGALANVEWFADLFPVVKTPGLLRDPGTALASVAASSVWASLGFTFLLVTAGLQGIPATSTKRPRSTAPAASASSGASPSRCSARRCCSCSSCSPPAPSRRTARSTC